MTVTPIADMVEQMFETGASPETIVAAVRTVELAVELVRERRTTSDDNRPTNADAQVERRRERDRDYQFNRRQSLKNSATAKANDVAVPSVDGGSINRPTSDDGADERCNLLTSFLSSGEEVETEEVSKKSKKDGSEKCARATRMSADAQISEIDFQFALNAGARRERIPPMWAEFVDYWISVPGQRGTKLNWSATWRNRVREVLAREGGNGKRSGNSGRASERDYAAALVRGLGGGDGPASGDGGEEIPSGRVNIDA